MNLVSYSSMHLKLVLKSIKQTLLARGMSFCKANLRLSFASCLLVTSAVGCTPGDTNNYLTIYGTDKKQSDDDGYSGNGGTGDGGGGQGVSCSSETRNTKLRSKLLVRDIFEVVVKSTGDIISLPPNTPEVDEISDAALEILVHRLSLFFGPATEKLDFGRKNFWRDFSKRIAFISDDASLHVSHDANSPIALPAGCKIVQIAFWNDSLEVESGGTLHVDRGLWLRLDQINKVALLAHEYFFKEARKAGYKNSDFIRGRIGDLFSTNAIKPLFSKWVASPSNYASSVLPNKKAGFKYCTGSSDQDPLAKVILYQYKGSDDRPYFVIPYLKADLLSKSSLLHSEYVIEEVNPALLDFMYISRSTRQSKSFDFLMNQVGLQSIAGSSASASLKWHLVKNGAKVWQNFLAQGAGNPAKVSIEIQAMDDAVPKKPETPPTKEDMSRLILHNLRKVILNAANQGGVRDADEVLISSALLSLKLEVAEYISEGKMVNTFPRWVKALHGIERAYLSNIDPAVLREHAFQPGTLTTNNQLISLPVTLLKNEAGLLYDLTDVFMQLGASDSEFAVITKNSVLSVETSEEKISFSLDCRDYNEVYIQKALELPLARKKDFWSEIKFDLAKFRPLDQRTQSKYPDILKYLNQKAKAEFETARYCLGKETDEYCNGSGLYDLLTRNLSESQIQVTGCGSEDLDFAASISSINTARDSFNSTYSCLILRVGDNRYFQIFADAGLTLTDDDVHIIPIAPPNSFVDNNRAGASQH